MKNPVDVLKSLEDKSCNPTYRYERLYRNLYNTEFYLLVYKNIATSQGRMTAGADGNTALTVSTIMYVIITEILIVNPHERLSLNGRSFNISFSV